MPASRGSDSGRGGCCKTCGRRLGALERERACCSTGPSRASRVLVRAAREPRQQGGPRFGNHACHGIYITHYWLFARGGGDGVIRYYYSKYRYLTIGLTRVRVRGGLRPAAAPSVNRLSISAGYAYMRYGRKTHRVNVVLLCVTQQGVPAPFNRRHRLLLIVALALAVALVVGLVMELLGAYVARAVSFCFWRAVCVARARCVRACRAARRAARVPR